MEKTDWGKIGFGYKKTKSNVRAYYKDGQWSDLEVSTSEQINLHMAATCLHYGQEAFEGLKAFRGKDNKVRVFRMEENGKRLQDSAEGSMMAPVPIDLFRQAVTKAVKENEEFIPPYGSGASLYIRPLLIGTGPQIGVKPANEYMFVVFVMPVGPYFPDGFKPTQFVIMRQYDRSAPLGMGKYKVGGNYAASLVAGNHAHQENFAAVLYLDSAEKKYIDECGAANFFGIKGDTYVTPQSNSILPSITNKSLIQLAEDLGLKVERRKVAVEELADFSEVGACGTAAVITPIKRIYDHDLKKEYTYSEDVGPWSKKLYQHLQGIQHGEIADTHHWNTIIE